MDQDHHGLRTGRRRTVLNRLRNYFLTGVIVAAPLTITVYLTASIVNWVDGLVKPLIPRAWNPENYVPFPLPGTGLLVALTAITLLGFLAATIFGRGIVALGEAILARMPLVRNVYSALKQIFETALSERSSTFRQAGIIEYPRRGLWAVVFIATDTRGELHHRLATGGEDTISVFLPTTPNPTSGFLLFVPKSDVLVLDMSVEDAAKLVISAGLITPQWPSKGPRRRGLPAQGTGATGPEASAAGTPVPTAVPVRGTLEDEMDGRGNGPPSKER